MQKIYGFMVNLSEQLDDAGIENYPRAVNGGFLFQQEKGFNDVALL